MILDNIYYISFGIIIGILIGYFISKIIHLIKLKKIRKESIYKSKSIILGQINEQLAPLLPEFKYDFKDAIFIGKGIDYIIFDGLSLGKINNIVFLEIKTGKSQQNKNEKIIENAIKEKKIIYKLLKI